MRTWEINWQTDWSHSQCIYFLWNHLQRERMSWNDLTEAWNVLQATVNSTEKYCNFATYFLRNSTHIALTDQQGIAAGLDNLNWGINELILTSLPTFYSGVHCMSNTDVWIGDRRCLRSYSSEWWELYSVKRQEIQAIATRCRYKWRVSCRELLSW